MDFETLEYAVEDGVVTVTLNRPDNLNSMNALMRRERDEGSVTAKMVLTWATAPLVFHFL